MNIEIDNDTAAKLNALAAAGNMTVDELLRAYVVEKADFIREKTEDQKIWEAAQNGHFVHNDAVTQWLDSWGTDKELPCPTVK